MANTKLPSRLLDTSAVPALNVTGDLTVDTTTLKVDSSNNRVGIGTSSPDQLLSVKGRISSDLNDDYYGAWLDGNSAANQDNFLGLGPWHNNAGYIKFFQSGTPHRLSIYTTNTGDHVTLQEAGGNVGIGDSTPDTKLHVSGNVKVGTAASSTWAESIQDLGGLDVVVGSGSTGFRVWDDNAQSVPRFIVLRAGNVGIGAASPAQKLEVAGRIRATTDPTFEAYEASGKRGGLQWDATNDFLKLFSVGGDIVFESQNNSGNIGIGTTSPTRTLDINHASTAPDLRLGCDGNDAPMIILDADVSSAEDTISHIVFRWNNTDTSLITAYAGTDTTNKDDGGLKFSTRKSGSATTERMRIADDGTTTIGRAITTTYDNDQGYPLHIQAAGGSQTYLSISLPGANSGNTGLVLGHDNTGSRILNREAEPIIFHANAGSETMRMLAGGGLTFNGDTAVANALDDYEEGSWTPVCNTSNANASIVTTVNFARYIKVGGLVHISAYMTLNISSVGSGAAVVTGLPFTATSGQGYSVGSNAHGTALASAQTHGVAAYVTNGTTQYRMVGITDAANPGWVGTGYPKYLMIDATYHSV